MTLKRIFFKKRSSAPEVLNAEPVSVEEGERSISLALKAQEPEDIELNVVELKDEELAELLACEPPLFEGEQHDEPSDDMELSSEEHDAHSDSADVLALAAEVSKPKRKFGLFKRKLKTEPQERAEPFVETPIPTKESRKSKKLRIIAEKRKHIALPIRVLMGFLPEVSGKDARDYALGVAERHFDQPAIAFFDAFKYEDGFAYEVHEGGTGVAYLPEILEYFSSLGPYEAGEDHNVTVLTGSRKVQVSRTATGISAILLPESSTVKETEWLRPSQKMTPALNQRTGLLVVGALFFVTGFFAVILSSSLTRIQPIIPAPPAGIETIAYDNLPISQWPRLLNLAPNTYVTKLVYENKKWHRPEVKSAQEMAAEAAELTNPTPPAADVIAPSSTLETN